MKRSSEIPIPDAPKRFRVTSALSLMSLPNEILVQIMMKLSEDAERMNPSDSLRTRLRYSAINNRLRQCLLYSHRQRPIRWLTIKVSSDNETKETAVVDGRQVNAPSWHTLLETTTALIHLCQPNRLLVSTDENMESDRFLVECLRVCDDQLNSVRLLRLQLNWRHCQSILQLAFVSHLSQLQLQLQSQYEHVKNIDSLFAVVGTRCGNLEVLDIDKEFELKQLNTKRVVAHLSRLPKLGAFRLFDLDPDPYQTGTVAKTQAQLLNGLPQVMPNLCLQQVSLKMLSHLQKSSATNVQSLCCLDGIYHIEELSDKLITLFKTLPNCHQVAVKYILCQITDVQLAEEQLGSICELILDWMEARNDGRSQLDVHVYMGQMKDSWRKTTGNRSVVITTDTNMESCWFNCLCRS